MPTALGLAGSAGEVLVQYEKQLSTGAMGSVWLGRLASGAEVGRLVTVRRISFELLDVSDIERIRMSADACARLRSPSLVKLLGVTQINNELSCVSEYLAGVRLSDLQRCLVETESSIPPGVAVRLVLEAARSGVVAHRLLANLGILASQRVVFSDGVLVALFGETLLTDVGVMSCLLRCPRIACNPAVIAGLSPEEISSPEGACGSPEVFTLGVVLWELLTSRWLFSRHLDLTAMKSAVIRQPIAPVASVERMGLPVPEPLARLLGQATERDPRKRYGSLESFIDAIEQLPSHCVASIEQLGTSIRALAPLILPECDNSAIWPLDAQRGRHFSSSSPPISLGPAELHDWDPPTFAERQLVAPVFEAERVDDNGSELMAPVFALSLPVFQEVPRKRTKPIVVGSALILITAVALTLSFFLQRRASAVAKATADPIQNVAAGTSGSPQNALPGAQQPTQPSPVETSSIKPVATAEPPTKQEQKARPAPPAEKATSKPPSVNNQIEAAPSGTYRPHKILPFHPKGI